MFKSPRPLIALLLAIGLLALACNRRDVDQIGDESTPLVLLLAPAHGATAELRQQMAEGLSELAGFAVDVRVAPTAEAAITTAGTAQADAWLVPLFSYLFCVQEYGVEAALQVVRQGGERDYTGEILVRADSDITTAEALDGHRIAYVDPQSTSGFLLPAAYLREAGVETEHTFTGSHDAALQALRDDEVDAAGVYQGAAASDGEFRVLASTGSVPNEPVFFRSGLDSSLRERFSQALVEYAQTDAGARTLGAVADIIDFVPVTNANYGDVDQTLRLAGKDLEDLVPRGWQIRNQNRLSTVDYAP